jgi:hypothetical protein
VFVPSKLIPQRRLDTDDAAFRLGPASQKGKNNAAPLPTSSTAIKRTTAKNNVAFTRTTTSAAPASKAKKSKQAEPTMGMQDEDDSHEEEVALASPVKGFESRKMNNLKVSHDTILLTHAN